MRDKRGAQGADWLLLKARRFDKQSRDGNYYESFNVNSKNYREKSDGTRRWISACNRLLGLCVAAAVVEADANVRAAFESVFNLLRRIDEGYDDVIFFADEAGSWQVGVNWNEALPAYFACVAASADPQSYALAVVAVVDAFEGHRRDTHFRYASKLGTRDQQRALDLATAGP